MKKIIKTFMLGICLSLFATSFTFASTNDAALFSTQSTTAESALTKKQAEIDKYLFEDHVKDISEKGFSVTHTGQVENAVEIGITPFTKKNADYLYGIFGKDKVKVVGGMQAQLMNGTVTTTSAVDAKVDTSNKSLMQNPLIYAVLVVILIAAVGITYKVKVAKR
jgi:hypothetical protein